MTRERKSRAVVTVGRQTVYSTGQVAKLLGVAPRTVVKWYDSGQLKGYQLPSAGARITGALVDRRIYRDSVLAFARRAGMVHLLAELAAGQRGAVLGLDGLDAGAAVRALLSARGVEVVAARSCVEAAGEGARVVVASPLAEGPAALRSLGSYLSGLPAALLLAVLPDNDDAGDDDAAARLAAAGWEVTREAGAALALANLLDGATAPGKGGAA